MNNPYLPWEAEVVERVQESDSIFTLRLRLTDPEARNHYRFVPGQFNMVYLYGVGEVAISIVSDPESEALLDHTIRAVGRVTHGLAKLQAGERVGIRGPFGRGWPMPLAEGRDVFIVTGGLGCAPVVGVINYVLARRTRFGRVCIVQGVKHAEDMIWRERYAEWSAHPDVQVLLAAEHGGVLWPWHVGLATELFDQAVIEPSRTIVMMCGPEGMMRAAARGLMQRGIAPEEIYLSMERNMQCGVGHCGHCQFGGSFICRNGPVYRYSEVRELLGVKGF
ncbi:cytochrome-c3 hydrogenase gamma chain [Sulfuriferula multivorans]|uniref:Cytochrome-c3 hydrogenase gamma chain n=1 Tax=Sulfuriferula multivorans TaxID=1559896 RepID=A0A401K093_9PROT|nr:FAD/NAD(P)-binding protein [Sulfuriferula multivorans]GCB02055.1 cytochrome-c3 hydrogenase gamma chain [Sulfuriferula multivorans]